MKEQLKKVLKTCDSVDFQELKHLLHFRNSIIEFMSNHNLTEEQMAKKFQNEHKKYDKKFFKAVMNCTYPVDMMTIAVFEAIFYEVIKEENPVVKIESVDHKHTEKNYNAKGTIA